MRGKTGARGNHDGARGKASMRPPQNAGENKHAPQHATALGNMLQ